ncbi:hypothetical protein [Hyphomonas sp.]|jgi:hypothetical protein|uniref:hypothetical protein n=1 Tax=Hyphomonas sp. TaxID=87 RepID=UPI0025BC3170|nr:hypothetical protein [Hyphomonas sp.]|tara:strand:+ start:2716 stop:3183 length:468 start_codon:yes stop_codon:yes gene_type:complete
MAAVSSTFVDPSLNFVWWIEGDKIAIATTDGDGGTSETAQGRYKAPIIGSSTDYITSGMLISYYAEPDKIDNSSGTGISATIDLDNSLHTALIAYVKSRALMDAAARETDPAQANVKLQMANMFIAEYRSLVQRYGARRRDKTGGTRGIVPANFT